MKLERLGVQAQVREKQQLYLLQKGLLQEQAQVVENELKKV